MKTLIKIVAIAALLTNSTATFGQLNHGMWQGHINVRGNSFLLPYGASSAMNLINAMGGGSLSSETDLYNNSFSRWIQLIPEYDIHVPTWQMESADGEVPLKGPYWWRCILFGDFDHDYNLSMGYTLYYRSLDIPFGFNFGINHEWRGICVTDGPFQGLHKTTSIIPHARINWRILGTDFEREHFWNIQLEGGTSYVKHLSYNNSLGFDSDIINDGLRASVGMALVGKIFSTPLNIGIRYEWDCYNYFNLPDTKTKLGSLVIVSGIFL